MKNLSIWTLLPVFIVICCGPAYSQGLALVESPNPLLEAAWKRRILVVCEADDEPVHAPFAQTQYDMIDWAGFLERDLMMVLVNESSLTSFTASPNQAPNKVATVASMGHLDDETALRTRTGCSGEMNFIALIGKDGGLKARWDEPIGNSVLFGLIDSMPMRAREMQRRSAE